MIGRVAELQREKIMTIGTVHKQMPPTRATRDYAIKDVLSIGEQGHKSKNVHLSKWPFCLWERTSCFVVFQIRSPQICK